MRLAAWPDLMLSEFVLTASGSRVYNQKTNMELEFAVLESPLQSGAEVTRLEYDLHNLVINIEPIFDAPPIVVTFESAIGFRVLDEGDLVEFWKHLSSKDGWLFQILAGGWFELESQRDGFISQHNSHVCEYLIVGPNECVSVLAYKPPLVAKP